MGNYASDANRLRAFVGDVRTFFAKRTAESLQLIASLETIMKDPAQTSYEPLAHGEAWDGPTVSY